MISNSTEALTVTGTLNALLVRRYAPSLLPTSPNCTNILCVGFLPPPPISVRTRGGGGGGSRNICRRGKILCKLSCVYTGMQQQLLAFSLPTNQLLHTVPSSYMHMPRGYYFGWRGPTRFFSFSRYRYRACQKRSLLIIDKLIGKGGGPTCLCYKNEPTMTI